MCVSTALSELHSMNCGVKIVVIKGESNLDRYKKVSVLVNMPFR